MKTIFVITWKYHNDNSTGFDDSGVVSVAYFDEKKAREHMKLCVNGNFTYWNCNNHKKPTKTIRRRYAKCEDGYGNYYEYKINKLDIED